MKVLGVSDSVLVCQCCGKKPLKKTIALEHDSGEVFYYGTHCASYAAGENEKNVSRSEIDSACEVFAIKEKCSSFKEFVSETKRRGYGFRIKSPLDNDGTDVVKWVWNELEIGFNEF